MSADASQKKVFLVALIYHIHKEFTNGNLQTETDIDLFATKFAVDPKLVKEYVQHLNNLKQRSQKSCSERKEKSAA